jgi:hypothetical protein
VDLRLSRVPSLAAISLFLLRFPRKVKSICAFGCATNAGLEKARSDPSCLRDSEWEIPALSEAVVHKQFILLLGMFLGSQVPTAAQTPAPQIVPVQDRTAPLIAMVPAPLLPASFLLPENPGRSAAPFSYLIARAYEPDQGLGGLESLSPMLEVKTLFLTQSSLPLVQLWGGRLRLDGFTSTLHLRNAQLGPSVVSFLQDFRPQRESYPGGPRSVDLYGVSLSFHFGRDAQIGRPTQIWRYIARIVAAAR